MLCPNCGSENNDNAQNCSICGSAFNLPVAQHLPTGAKLANGRYSIGKVLGEGGFGVTYQGADTTMKRLVAIKELFPDGSTRNDFNAVPPRALGTQGFAEHKASFLKEVSVLAQFHHDSIVSVYDTFEDNATAYMVMEFLKGETLAQHIGRLGVLSGLEALEIAKKLCAALQIIHEVDLLHRDIKPDNIFFTEDERIVLIDFGSARQFADNKTSRHTQFLTPGYAPLEQYASEAKFGPYTDIYALGATLYHALAGHPPANANDRIMGIELNPLPQNTPIPLKEAIERSLAVKVKDRPQSIGEFTDILEQKEEVKSSKEFPKEVLEELPTELPTELSPQERHILKAHRGYASTIAFSPDGQTLISGSDDKTLRVWEVSSGKLIRTLAGHRDAVFAVCFILDGKDIAAGSGDMDVSLWHLAKGHRYDILRGHSGGVLALAYDTNKRILASGSGDNSVRLWQLPGNQLIHVLEKHRHPVRSLAFNHNGTILASGSEDFTIKLWDTKHGRFTTNIIGHTDAVIALAFNPQGNLLVSGSQDDTIKIWEVNTSEAIHTLTDHSHWVRAINFSPDGRLLVSGSADKTIKIWEAATGKLLHTLVGHSDWVKDIAFSPDGRLLASAGGDSIVKLWDLY